MHTRRLDNRAAWGYQPVEALAQRKLTDGARVGTPGADAGNACVMRPHGFHVELGRKSQQAALVHLDASFQEIPRRA